MTIFLIVFFLYILLRIYFRNRQNAVGNIYLVGSRVGILPDYVRGISIVGMAGIALVIVILTIMGYRLTPDHIALMLTIGIVVMTLQYLPLIMIGENGIVSIDTQVNWNDVTSARIANKSNNGSAKVKLEFSSSGKNSSLDLYIHSDQIPDLEKIVNELSKIKLEESIG